ncbi:hypothetical protein NMY22_g15023 [Coprinellus aureogranulatus]|nr:hypothetical protein NMY22_g15023 [Coprinellus aureogranulatus]
MGRPRLYHTREEQLDAARKRSQRYYEKNKATVCESRKKKYAASKVVEPRGASQATQRPRAEVTELERKVKNRKKSQRSYARRKSIPSKRRSNKGEPTASPGTGLHTNPYTEVRLNRWAERLAYVRRDFNKALHHCGVEDFVDKTAMAYIETGFQSVLDSAARPFNALHCRLQDLQEEVLHEMGAGARLGDFYGLSLEIMGVIRKLEDLWESGALRGHERFTEWYTDLREGRIFHRSLV